MDTLPLGNSDHQVSAMCLGAMNFGTKTDTTTSRLLLDQYAEAGGRFVDTANCYAAWTKHGHAGDSEQLIGDWLQTRTDREAWFIATKVGFGWKAKDGRPGAAQGLRADDLLAQCDASLKRLQRTHIDLYFMHLDDRTIHVDEWLTACDTLYTAGKIRATGLSNFASWRMMQAIDCATASHALVPCASQLKHTLLVPEQRRDYLLWPPATDEHLDVEETYNIRRIAYSPLLKGAYQRQDRKIPSPYRSAENNQRLSVLRSIARDHGATPNQIVLAWMLQQPRPIIPLFAASNEQQLAENLGALRLQLSKDEHERLR